MAWTLLYILHLFLVKFHDLSTSKVTGQIVKEEQNFCNTTYKGTNVRFCLPKF
jgi:hypothetical protein